MEVSRSGYYDYLKSQLSAKTLLDVKLQTEVKVLAASSRNSYGSRRIAKSLQAQGYQVGRYKARSLMRQAEVTCKQRRRYKNTTDSQHKLPIVSISRKGNCWDNAVMERFWGSLKSERTQIRIYVTRDAAKADVIDYIEMFYNSIRLHSTLHYVSPMQFEKRFLLNNVSVFTWPGQTVIGNELILADQLKLFFWEQLLSESTFNVTAHPIR